jgi:hypothetical protein
MSNKDGGERRKHEYPPFWDKIVPIALTIIAIIMVILLGIIVGVALGLFPGG